MNALNPLLASLGLALPALALAQTPAPTSLDPVVVTATRSPQRLSEVIADVTVLTRADIERLGPGGIADLLRREAGLELSRNGGPAASTSLFLRGSDSRHSLLLIDGLRIDSQATGGASWQGVPLAQIERIEILHGPASALYGSDAIGGVVQLFTRQGADGWQGELLAAAGSQGLRRSEASLSGGTSMLRLAATLAHEEADGFNASTDPTGFAWSPDRDGWDKRSAHLRATLQPSKTQRVDATLLASRSRAQFDGYDPSADDRDRQRTQGTQLRWSADWTSTLRTEASAGESEERYDIPNFFYATATRVRQAGLLAFWRPAREWQLQGQLEQRSDRLRSDDLADGAESRRQRSLGLGAQHSAAGNSQQLQIRHDRDSRYGDQTTGWIGASWSLGQGWQFASSAGTAFRAPTVYQLASPYGVRTLKPEEGQNLEASLRWREGAHSASLTAYRNTVKNLIGFGAGGPCASPWGCYANTSRALLQGVSAKGQTQALGLAWRASVDAGEAENRDSGQRLARRAKLHGSIGVGDELGAFGWSATLLATGSRYDDAANSVRLGGFAQLDLEARWQLARDWRLEAQVSNAFDRANATAAGYAGQPRALLLGLRWTPKS